MGSLPPACVDALHPAGPFLGNCCENACCSLAFDLTDMIELLAM
jgi:hypothetical protein